MTSTAPGKERKRDDAAASTSASIRLAKTAEFVREVELREAEAT